VPGEPGSVFEHPDPVPGHSDCEARRDDYISGACTGDDAGVERFPDDCESPAECPGAHSSPFDNSAPFNPRGCEASFNSSTARACFESSAQADRITASRMRSPTSNGAEAPPGFAAPPAAKKAAPLPIHLGTEQGLRLRDISHHIIIPKRPVRPAHRRFTPPPTRLNAPHRRTADTRLIFSIAARVDILHSCVVSFFRRNEIKRCGRDELPASSTAGQGRAGTESCVVSVQFRSRHPLSNGLPDMVCEFGSSKSAVVFGSVSEIDPVSAPGAPPRRGPRPFQ